MKNRCDIVRNPQRPLCLSGPVCATLGNLDGVHLGHQALLSRLRQFDANRILAISFYPHPGTVVRREVEVPRITSLRQKRRLLAQHGVTHLVMLHFSERFSRMSAQEFVDQVLIGICNVQRLVVGPDACVGRNREGTVSRLQELLAPHGARVEVVPFVELGADRVSSRRVRALLADGRVEDAAPLLGRPFTLEGKVIRGQQRGRTIGFPTLNIAPRSQLLPKYGVYITRCLVHGRSLPAVTNVGVRPTVGGTGPLAETHLLDFDRELYDARVEVEFLARIRDEERFESFDALRRQISQDVAQARHWHARQEGES